MKILSYNKNKGLLSVLSHSGYTWNYSNITEAMFKHLWLAEDKTKELKKLITTTFTVGICKGEKNGRSS